MNVGMIIGSDGKLNVILNTLKILSHKCKTIVICDTGNWIINPSIEEKIKFFKNVKYIPCGGVGSYFLFECHKIIQRNLPLDEWFLYLDADERPCSNLLDDWDGITNKLDELQIE